MKGCVRGLCHSGMACMTEYDSMCESMIECA